jgi:putative membrane protein
MMYDWWNGGGWHMGFGWLFMLLPLLLVVAVFVALSGKLGGNSERGTTSKGAREILDERFARGEIDRDEYEMRRKALNN